MQLIHHLDGADSTNDVAHDMAARGALDGTVVVAKTQAAGRGRRGRDWFSPDAGNVYLSYIHRSRLQPADLSALTLDAAIAVATALEDLAGVRVDLKWPNDLLVDGKKLGGILSELHTELCPNGAPVVIIGVGVNVAIPADGFPELLQPIATSVQMVTGVRHDPAALATLIARRLREKLAGYESARGPDLVGYMARFPFVGTPVVHDDRGEGVIAGVNADGGLEVRWSDGRVESVHSGEITFPGTEVP